MYLGDVIKDPAEVLDYSINWSDWLATDTIATSTVAADAGLTVESASHDNTQVVIWIGALAAQDTWYEVKNTVTTAGGRTGVRRFRIKGVLR